MREQLAGLVAAADGGEIGEGELALAESVLELGLQSGRIRSVYGPEGEQAALKTYRRLPGGRALADSASDVSEALSALAGKTLDDVKAAIAAPPGSAPAGPPPYVFHGGVAAIAPGTDQVFQPDLEPGDYLLVCFITDPATGKPHFALGMVTPITVR
jgi:hypothetical protein